MRLLTSTQSLLFVQLIFIFLICFTLSLPPPPRIIACQNQQEPWSQPCLYFRNEDPEHRRIFFLCLV